MFDIPLLDSFYLWLTTLDLAATGRFRKARPHTHSSTARLAIEFGTHTARSRIGLRAPPTEWGDLALHRAG